MAEKYNCASLHVLYGVFFSEIYKRSVDGAVIPRVTDQLTYPLRSQKFHLCFIRHLIHFRVVFG